MRYGADFTRHIGTMTIVVACLLLEPVIAAERNAAYRAALHSITADELGDEVDTLADDEFDGREAGTPGGRKAGDYLAGVYQKLGLTGAAANGSCFQPFGENYRNIVMLLGGRDPKMAREVIVVGAHYDHVGHGTKRNSRGPVGYVHPGADDNASGSAALVELAEALTFLPEPPRRSILFIAFDGEEKGLLGSRYWVSSPTLAPERVKIMVNVDMVGRLRNDRLEIFGVRTGYGLRRLISEQNDDPTLNLAFDWRLKAEGDHYPFFERQMPSLTLHTGLHDDYHTPRDTADRIDQPGLERVGRLLFALVYALAEGDTLPRYRGLASGESEQTREAIEGRAPVLPERLGVAWQDDAPSRAGLPLSRIVPGSPAQRAGLQAGDVLVSFDGQTIHSGDELRHAVGQAQGRVAVIVHRENNPLDVQVELAGTPMRLGIVWRTDEAEPGAVVLTYVAPGSPAARAGLEAGDRVYRVNGQNFASEAEFQSQVRAAEHELILTAERQGRMRTVAMTLTLRGA